MNLCSFYFAILLLLGGAFLSSCEKADSFTQFEMDFKETITISAGTPLDVALDIVTPSMETNYESVFASYNTNRERIEEIILKELVIKVESPDDGTLNFLESGEMRLKANGDTSGAIATFTNEEENATELEAITSDINIKDYLSVDEFGLAVSLVTDEVLTQDYELEISTTFFIDAKVLGQ